MADNNIEAWDSENFQPLELTKVGRNTNWDDEDADQVKDNWEDSGDEEKVTTEDTETTVYQTSKPKASKESESSITKKGKGYVGHRELTKAEQEKAVKNSDLQFAFDLLGSVGDGVASEEQPTQKSYYDFKSNDDYKEFSELLAAQLLVREKADFFPDFVSDLIYKLTESMEAKHIRRLSNELKARADLKANKEKPKKQQLIKPSIKSSSKGAKKGQSMYADDVNLDADGFDDYDEDFM